MSAFRAIALIAARNEEDVIGHVVGHLISEGISVYLIDDGSTDDTVAEASRWLNRGLLKIEHRPRSSVFDWEALLRRKEALCAELDADWFLHHDADEFRQSPWPGQSLLDGIRQVDVLGYNAIDFHVFNFPPTHDRFVRGMDVRLAFTHFEPAPSWDRFQIKAWKRGATVDLVSSGGHDAAFTGRRVCPIQFLCRHYPIRGQAHGTKKVLEERLPRFSAPEIDRGWHVQYNHLDKNPMFLRDPGELREYDAAAISAELLTGGREGYLRRLEAEIADKTHQALAAAKAEAERALRDQAGALDAATARAESAETEWRKIRSDWELSQASLRGVTVEMQRQSKLLDDERAAAAARAASTAEEVASLRSQLSERMACEEQSQRRVRQLEEEIVRLASELKAVYRSWSWRATRPVRRAYELLNPSATPNPSDRQRRDAD